METITYERLPHIIEKQYAAEQAFLAEFEAGHYTLDNPLVKLNPYELSPLWLLSYLNCRQQVKLPSRNG